MQKNKYGYSLYVPFFLIEGREISELPQTFNEDSYEFLLECSDKLYSLTVSDFVSEEEARKYFGKIKLALLGIPYIYKIGVNFPKSISSVDIYDSPIRLQDGGYLDGDYNGRDAVIINNQQKLSKVIGLPARVKVGTNAKYIISSFREIIRNKNINSILSDNKLLLALDLYSSYFFENTSYSRFIILITIIEALSPSLGDEKISPFAQNELNIITRSLGEKIALYKETEIEYGELKSLQENISKLEKKGTTKLIKNYIKETVKNNPSIGKHKDITKQILNAYDARCKLLHKGKIDTQELDRHLSFLNTFIPNLLNILIQEY